MTRREAGLLTWSVDLIAVVLYTTLAAAVVVGDVGGPALRTVLVLPLAAFLPGYALVAAFYPERYRVGEQRGEGGGPSEEGLPGVGISPLVRGLVAVATSIILVPLVVFVVDLVHGVYIVPIVLTVAGLTALLTVVAAVRRLRLDDRRRFTVVGAVGVAREARKTEQQSVTGPYFTDTSGRGQGAERPFVVLFALSLLVVVASVTAAAALPFAGIPSPQEEQFTELYLTTQAEDGEYVIGDYPTDFSSGDSSLFVTIGNDEGDRTRYTVVASVQRVEGGTVTESMELTRFERTVAAGETARIEHSPQPPIQGENVRITYMLYRGDAPSNPSVDSAYRSIWVWTAGGGSGGERSTLVRPTVEVAR